MNEQTLSVLEQYDFRVYKTVRARGGFLCNTSNGIKLLCECSKPDSYYERESEITRKLADNANFQVDTYVRNERGELLTQTDEGRYYVKDWTTGRECNTDCIGEVENAARLMAYMHIALNGQAGAFCSYRELVAGYERHTKELRSIWNYLKAKKSKNSFELMLYKNFETFFEETKEFSEKMSGIETEDTQDAGMKCGAKGEILTSVKQMSHGSFNHHNILVEQNKYMLVNFDKAKHEYNMVDLYRFMRKILEKHNWSLHLAYRMIECYDSVKNIENCERKLLSGLFTYPEKFWKIANYYYNSNKAWMPQKNTVKLENVIEQNPNKKRFVNTLG